MVAKSGINSLAVSKKNKQDDKSETRKKGSLESVVKALMKSGKEKGFLTYDEINNSLPPEEFTSEQIDETMAKISESGVQLVEKEDDVEEPEDNESYESGGNIASDDTGRTDDPVRMYLREMGTVELLSREGEIAIAKRIEAGKEMMIGGICESPLAIESLIAWHEALQRGDILLREIIDLDATYSEGDEELESDDDVDEEDEGEEGDESSGSDSEDDEVNISLSAMEEELMEQVLDTFNKIKKTYKKMQKVQQERLDALSKGKEPTPATNKKYTSLKEDMVKLMDEVRFEKGGTEIWMRKR